MVAATLEGRGGANLEQDAGVRPCRSIVPHLQREQTQRTVPAVHRHDMGTPYPNCVRSQGHAIKGSKERDEVWALRPLSLHRGSKTPTTGAPGRV